MADTNLGGPTTAELEKRNDAALHAKLDAIAAKIRLDVMGEVAESLATYDVPNRSGLPEIVNRKGETVHRQECPWRDEYRQLPAWQREIRNPDSDHWMLEAVRGISENDHARRGLANDKLRVMFPEMYRADALEGTASGVGGFAAGTAGYLLPRPLEQLVAVARDRTAKMWRWATTYVMTAQEHNVPTGAAMTGYMQGEATSPTTQGEPTWAQVALIAYNCMAKAVLGNDMLEDSAVNVISFITNRGGKALAVVEDQEFFKAGTGSSPHVTKLSGTSLSETTSTILDYSTVLKMYSNVQQEYRDNARWFVNATVLNLMANVRDGFGRPFYQSLLDPPMAIADTPDGSPMQGAVGTLLGKAVHEVPLTAGDIWFGDPAATYAIGRRRGITVDVSKEFYFDTRRTIFLLSQRIAGNNLETVSAQLVAGITTANSL